MSDQYLSVLISLIIHRLAAYPTSPAKNNNQSPLIQPAVEPRHITHKELQSFQNPENLHGKQFILSPDTSNLGVYEVIGYYKARDKAVTFDVLFADCEDSITISKKEMIGMLHDSVYLPVQ